jgi:hypothetical protein
MFKSGFIYKPTYKQVHYIKSDAIFNRRLGNDKKFTLDENEAKLSSNDAEDSFLCFGVWINWRRLLDRRLDARHMRPQRYENLLHQLFQPTQLFLTGPRETNFQLDHVALLPLSARHP